MSQFAYQTQKQFAELQASHERMKTLTGSMDKIVKTLQEGHAQLSKASEETNKRLNQVFEEQHHRKRERDYLDQYINKIFNVYNNMKPQPQGHVRNTPYHQEYIKTHATLDVRKRTNIWKYSPYTSSGFREKQHFRLAFKDKPIERVAEVTKKHNPCHNCGSTYHDANNCPKEKKKVYAIEKVPEEESSTEDSDSDSMGDAIREQSDYDQDPREELLVEYQEETTVNPRHTVRSRHDTRN
ncbi:hypothetical protein O181_019971 [Austropuccinia psidii MF-1]|uniref:CCHC-type domain-containing protein n=1 Tax=Austropuccinia psidii MF-1 TaxID=1389203 RepID=A0A9Q3C884_9BASI|nr:hypothetical protein [Austropuccinia psidii MF-1]